MLSPDILPPSRYHHTNLPSKFDNTITSRNMDVNGSLRQNTLELSNIQLQVPSIAIREQPSTSGARFRYASEGSSSVIYGVNRVIHVRETYPSVMVYNVTRPVKLVVSAITSTMPYFLHPYKVIQLPNVDNYCSGGIYQRIITTNQEIQLEKIAIESVRKVDMINEIQARVAKGLDVYSAPQMTNRSYKIDLGEIRLCVQLYQLIKNNYEYVTHVVSDVVWGRNKELLLKCISRKKGCIHGGDEVFILGENFERDIEVIFCDHEGWQQPAQFHEGDLHQKVALVVKTPQYKTFNVFNDVTAYIYLKIPSDNRVSRELNFTYVSDQDDIRRKCYNRQTAIEKPLSQASSKQTQHPRTRPIPYTKVSPVISNCTLPTYAESQQSPSSNIRDILREHVLTKHADQNGDSPSRRVSVASVSSTRSPNQLQPSPRPPPTSVSGGETKQAGAAGLVDLLMNNYSPTVSQSSGNSSNNNIAASGFQFWSTTTRGPPAYHRPLDGPSTRDWNVPGKLNYLGKVEPLSDAGQYGQTSVDAVGYNFNSTSFMFGQRSENPGSKETHAPSPITTAPLNTGGSILNSPPNWSGQLDSGGSGRLDSGGSGQFETRGVPFDCTLSDAFSFGSNSATGGSYSQMNGWPSTVCEMKICNQSARTSSMVSSSDSVSMVSISPSSLQSEYHLPKEISDYALENFDHNWLSVDNNYFNDLETDSSNQTDNDLTTHSTRPTNCKSKGIDIVNKLNNNVDILSEGIGDLMMN